MPLVAELRGLLRLAAGVRVFARDVISPAAARALILERMRTREQRFLRTLERAVFGHPGSPYGRLLQQAGAGLADVRRAVERDGLESSLAQLAAAGVFVSWEEFKGHRPAVRGSRTFQFDESDFDSPLTRHAYVAGSGGSFGRPVRVKVDLDFIAQLAPNLGVWFDAQGWAGRPLVFWTPAHTGLATRYLMCVRIGYPFLRWFVMADMRAPLDRLRAATVHRLCRGLLGLPRSVPGTLDRVPVVLDGLLQMLGEGHRPLVNTSPSAAARLASEARARGRSLEGVAFLLGAEPVTPERRAAIESAGARSWPTYGTSESGWIGSQFADATEPDEVHVFRDAYAVIAGDRDRGGDAPLRVTSLLDASPKVLLNAELGDSACLETTPGSLSARAFGYDLRLHSIRSVRKLTAFGVTIAAADVYPLLERTLPEQFGGSVGDFQLVEDQDAAGASRLCLMVSPEVGPVDEAAVRRTLLGELAVLRPHYRFMAVMVEQADALRVERRPPIRTEAGKILPVLPARVEPRARAFTTAR